MGKRPDSNFVFLCDYTPAGESRLYGRVLWDTSNSAIVHGRITNSVTGVSRPPVPDYGTTFHLDYGGRDLPSTPLESLSKPICLATEALRDSFEYIGAI